MKKLMMAALCALGVNVARAEDTRDYLSFTAMDGDVTIGMKWSASTTPPTMTHTFEWSADKANWTKFLTGSSSMTVPAGETVYFRRKGDEKVTTLNPNSEYFGWQFTMAPESEGATIAAGGNVMSLLDASCEQTEVGESAFLKLFYGCKALTAAPELPATELAMRCYYDMFEGCTALKVAPELPATKLAVRCYTRMFDGCTALTAAPELPATELTEYCYQDMFSDCTALKVAPELPAETLVHSCYYGMFYGCTALTAVPELPATALAQQCYESMFYGCTALTAAPELPAKTLAMRCYEGMFRGCTALTAAPELPAKTLAQNCYYDMFHGCTALTAAPELPAKTLAQNCYQYMFDGCKALGWIKVGFTAWDNSMSPATADWVKDVPTSGLFVCPSALNDQRDSSHIPSGWTKVDADSVRFVIVPKVEHLKTSVTATGSAVAVLDSADGVRRAVKAGAAVQVEFSADEGYAVKGTKSYSIDSLTDDVVFGTTEGYPLPEVVEAHLFPVMFTKGTGVKTIEFKCDDDVDFVEFPSEGTNLLFYTEIELKVTPEANYRYTGETQFTVNGKIDKTLTADEIAWGDVERPWIVGDDVRAYTNGTTLVITGSGEMYDFASADDVPWAAFVDDVTAVTIAEDVTKVGANSWVGMDGAVKIDGTALSAVRFLAPGVNSPAPTEPSGAVSGAEPETVRIVDGKVLLGVSVCTNGDVTVATEDWEPAAIEKAQVEEDGTVTLTVPATAEQGFMLLKSKGAAPSDNNSANKIIEDR